MVAKMKRDLSKGLPLILGLLLLAAAGLKAFDETQPSPRPLYVAGITLEAICGLLLIAGWRPSWMRLVSLCLFSAFFLLTFEKVIKGETSCGCFGRVALPPHLALFLEFVVLTS